MNDVGVIDRFLDVFSRYIDSGFGLLGGEVAFLTATLVLIDMTLAGLFWAMSNASGGGGDEGSARQHLAVPFLAARRGPLIGNARPRPSNYLVVLGGQARGAGLDYPSRGEMLHCLCVVGADQRNLRARIGMAVVLFDSVSVTMERTSTTPGSFSRVEKMKSWYQITSGARIFSMASISPKTV